MCIRDLIEQFEIQGEYCIKIWDDDYSTYITLAGGKAFEYEYMNIKEDYLNKKITYMYTSGRTLNIEVEM